MTYLLQKIVFGALLLVSLILTPITASANINSGLAVILIDMQYGFYTRGGVQNTEGLKKLVAHQKILMQWAVKNDIPILVFEYQNYKETDSLLMEVVKQNRYKVITKTADNGFATYSPSREPALEVLKMWGVDTLIVAGINGNACVVSTVQGAMGAGYDVISASDIVGNLNVNPPIYPNATWFFKDQKFVYFKGLEEIIN